MSCVACGRDLHEECPTYLDSIQTEPPVGQLEKCCCKPEKAVVVTSESRKGNNYKSDDEIGVSAGRKRAAVAYEIIPEKPCEWRWLKNCGGGKHPIIGCLGGLQEHRHHGPIKNTSHNEPENLHRICTNCHNRWHTLNDTDYDEEINSTLPHRPVPASLEECSDNEMKWKSGAFANLRAKDNS